MENGGTSRPRAAARAPGGTSAAGCNEGWGKRAAGRLPRAAEFATRVQIDRYFREHDVRPRVLMEANSPGAVIEIVRRTNLAALLPATIAAGHDDLAAVALDPAVLRRAAVLLQRKGAYRSAAARAFVELALARGAGKSSGESMARATRKRTSG